MPSIAEGLTVEGQPVAVSGDVNSEAGFAAAVAAQVGGAGESPAPSTPTLSPQERDASRHSADEIVAGLTSEEPGTSIRSGLTVEGGPNRWGMTPEEEARVHREYVELERSGAFDAGRQANAKAEQEGERVRLLEEQNAALTYEANAPDLATYEDQAFALAHLKKTVGAETFEAYLERAAYESVGLDPEDDLAPEDLDFLDESFAELRESVDLAVSALERQDAVQRLERATHLVDQLSTRARREGLQTIKAFYAERGISDLDAVEQQYIRDRQDLAELGFDLATLDTATTRGALERLHAARDVYTKEAHHDAIRAEIAGVETTNVSAGYTTMSPLGYEIPLVPQPSPFAQRSQEEYEAAIDAQVEANKKRGQRRTRRSDFHEAVLQADSTDWRGGLTIDGRAVSMDDATGARERAEQERQEERARAMSAIG